MLQQAARNVALGAFNHLLVQAGWACQRLAPFSGRGLRLEPAGLPVLTVEIDPRGMLIPAAADCTVDVVVSLPAHLPLLALQGRDAILRQTRISGSADLAEMLGFVLRNLAWDAEEDLSRLCGDILAHRALMGVRRLTAWQREALRRAAENIGEYLTEESDTLIHQREMAPFAAEVDALDQALAATSRRLARLD
ncbi:MAG: hypothetical protein JSR19_01725 [Proteobacteria bacterium]|nr:hypothetical protein [Pseudomonadota bacterium]HQR03516.1 hypothetical protein [Rhodocyclaceae bacterium]